MMGEWGSAAAGFALLAAGSAAGAAWVWAGPCPGERLRAAFVGASARTTEWRRSLPRAVVLAAGGAAAFLVWSPVPLVLAPVVAVLADRYLRARAARQRAARTRAEVQRLCEALVGELRAGRPPADALAHAATEAGELGETLARAVSLGADVPAALREAAGRPGAAALARLAACWQVAQDSGAGLVAAVAHISEGLRADEAVRQEVTAQLAAPRATARLLAALPAFGLLLGYGLDADPLRILFGTPYGLACVVLGTCLDAAGVLWTERIARRAEEQP
ncbi:hypothetical protein TH66_17970 [Carbonactinospora thermoautotrophica]|uniref:Integral membrane protein n=2 Tax=Carbonactinospora thermoautotrophica TaxID=1469144 RepID=A0A132MN26_9ACTN|nr:hypothetical protein TH66_17970 [Carbonactinospora thermoautotrophica]KWW98811.1 Integral membrane protein [Carbonactinospora thermoautotrophica]